MEQMTDCISTLKERLAGVYKMKVDDGCGPLNGSDVFTRQFPVSPIMTEALARIEALEKALEAFANIEVGTDGEPDEFWFIHDSDTLYVRDFLLAKELLGKL